MLLEVIENVKNYSTWHRTTHVETMVQLSRKKGTPKIEVKMDVQDGDIPELKNRIQKYVMEKYGVHVHSRYIAEVKRMCGIEMGENYNKLKSINNFSLSIDKEGENGNTSKAAEQECQVRVIELDSKASCGIRMADMLAGLISKILKALHNALRYTTEETQLNKKILNNSWFNISNRQLFIYKKLHSVVVDLNKSWHKAFSGKYSDDLIVFTSFLNFMNNFDSVEAIKGNISMQGEYFNTYTCEILSDHYKRMRSEMQINPLPIDVVFKSSKDYLLNRRGAKVYFDINKQPLLEITKSSTIFNVLSVGFSQEMIPLITIEEAGSVKCYRLPTELSEWAMTLVGFANMGENLFPSEVMFTRIKDRLLADIL